MTLLCVLDWIKRRVTGRAKRVVPRPPPIPPTRRRQVPSEATNQQPTRSQPPITDDQNQVNMIT